MKLFRVGVSLAVLSSKMAYGAEVYQGNNFNSLLPPGLHYYKITYTNDAPDPLVLKDEVRELVLMGCHHAMPWKLLEPSQQDALKEFLKNKPLLAHEWTSLYHSKKLIFYVNFFLDLCLYSDIILNSTFIRYSEHKYNHRNSVSEVEWVVDYFKEVIRDLACPDTLIKLDLYDKIEGKNINNLLMYTQEKVVAHLPLNLVLNFLICYVKCTSVEYHILREMVRENTAQTYNLDDHEDRIKEEEGLFFEINHCFSLLADTLQLDALLQYYALPKDTIKVVPLPNQSLEKILDFICFLNQERKTVLLSTVASRVLMEGKIKKIIPKNHRNLAYEIESFRNGDFDVLTEPQIHNLQRRNYVWLCGIIGEICRAKAKQALIMFGASHLGGEARRGTYIGILDFFIDLLLGQNQEYWKALFANEGSGKWFASMNVLKIQRLRFGGGLVSIEEMKAP